MQFGLYPIEKAQGAILARSVRAGEARLRKGRVLSSDDVARLKDADVREVTVALLDAGDVGEDDAAARIAKACAGSGVRVGAAFTGRANLYSEVHGLAAIDAGRAHALNAIDEAITIATLAPFARVLPRRMLATIKIIPFAAPRQAVEDAERLLADGPLLRVAPFAPHRVALISTALADTKASLLDKNRSALDARVNALGSSIVFERRAPHKTQELSSAILEARKSSADPILVFGASAITDRRDVIPAALERAGGAVAHFGMPVDPGNLLLVGQLGGTNVIGVPGCARSPKLNGFDFVLWRLFADLPIGRAELAAMGVGGLLGEIASRPQPRDEEIPDAPRAPKIAAIVLAAGLSSRMGRNKLLAELNGKPLLRHAVEAAANSSADPVIVVTGNEGDKVAVALASLEVQTIANPDHAKGLSTSLKTGIAALPADCDGALVLLGDMPGVTSALLDRMIAGFSPPDDRAIIVASHGGKRGNPVLWARRFFPEILALEGDSGAKAVVEANGELVCEVEAADDGPLADIDTQQALAAYQSR
jgi:molybdenum cofactor cytidylyltransferase